MATLEVFYQKYIDLPDGRVLGIHHPKLLSSSDQFTVPTLDNTTAGVAVKQLVRNGDSALTVSNSNGNTVTIVGGVAGAEITVVTLHVKRRNNIPEA